MPVCVCAVAYLQDGCWFAERAQGLSMLHWRLVSFVFRQASYQPGPLYIMADSAVHLMPGSERTFGLWHRHCWHGGVEVIVPLLLVPLCSIALTIVITTSENTSLLHAGILCNHMPRKRVLLQVCAWHGWGPHTLPSASL